MIIVVFGRVQAILIVCCSIDILLTLLCSVSRLEQSSCVLQNCHRVGLVKQMEMEIVGFYFLSQWSQHALIQLFQSFIILVSQLKG